MPNQSTHYISFYQQVTFDMSLLFKLLPRCGNISVNSNSQTRREFKNNQQQQHLRDKQVCMNHTATLDSQVSKKCH